MDVLHFYRTAKAARQGVMKLYNAAAQSNSVKGVVGTKGGQEAKVDHERLAKLKDLLAKGQNPYSVARMKEAGKNLGGSDTLTERIIMPRDWDEQEIKAIAAKWDWRNLPKDEQEELLYLDGEDSLLDPETTQEALDPNKVVCAFCGELVDRINATEGKGRPRMFSEIEIVYNADGKPIGHEEKWHFRQQNIWACPDDVLKLTKIKWPETEG